MTGLIPNGSWRCGSGESAETSTPDQVNKEVLRVDQEVLIFLKKRRGDENVIHRTGEIAAQ